jgi:hypothetical protein
MSKDAPKPKDKPVVVSDTTLRRLVKQGGRIQPAPEKPVKTA